MHVLKFDSVCEKILHETQKGDHECAHVLRDHPAQTCDKPDTAHLKRDWSNLIRNRGYKGL